MKASRSAFSWQTCFPVPLTSKAVAAEALGSVGARPALVASAFSPSAVGVGDRTGPSNRPAKVSAPSGATVGSLGMAQPSIGPRTRKRPDTGNCVQTPGTIAATIATSSDSTGAAKQTAPASGIGTPTTTDQRDSDATIDQENTNADRTVEKICKN